MKGIDGRGEKEEGFEHEHRFAMSRCASARWLYLDIEQPRVMPSQHDVSYSTDDSQVIIRADT